MIDEVALFITGPTAVEEGDKDVKLPARGSPLDEIEEVIAELLLVTGGVYLGKLEVGEL